MLSGRISFDSMILRGVVGQRITAVACHKQAVLGGAVYDGPVTWWQDPS